MIKLAADQARCRVRTFKEGLMSAVGHDLVLEVKDFRLAIGDDQSIRAECRTDSLIVLGPSSLSDSDKRAIKKDLDAKVLEISRHPKATFRSTEVEPRGAETYRVKGRLALHGIEQLLEFEVKIQNQEATAELTIHQPSFGIKPFSAMFGALKVKADVIVEVTVPCV